MSRLQPRRRTPVNELVLAHPETTCRALRKRAGWTVAELAALAGVSISLLSKIETAGSPEDLGNLYVTSLVKVARALRTSPARLWPRLGRKLEVS